jgi:hypothetical protein
MRKTILGPCIGHTTTTSTKIWIYAEEYKKLYIKISKNSEEIQSKVFLFDKVIPAACVEILDLDPNTQYFYKISIDEGGNQPLDLEGLTQDDLYFWTMPDSLEGEYRYDFLLLSCNNPIVAKKKYKNKAWRVWEVLPQIIYQTVKTNSKTIKTNDDSFKSRVLFAIFSGDQVYADSIEKDILKEKNEETRLEKYLGIYKKYWDNKTHRKILCSLPTYSMWDDHDITDGWGSREDSFDDSNNVLEPWTKLFQTAKKAFSDMQAVRNPPALSRDGFDTAFIVGKAGFILADLRSNRSVRTKTIWKPSQFQAIKDWIELNREKIDILFFVSPVVFAHGSGKIDTKIIKYWKQLHTTFDRVWEIQHRFSENVKNALNVITTVLYIVFFIMLLFYPFISIFIVTIFLFSFYYYGNTCLKYLFSLLILPMFVDVYYDSIGDLRDDINDSWSSDKNEESAEKILDYFFALQNDPITKKQVYVTILTGDIHSAGYSNLYSSKPEHQNIPIIHHIVASPVAHPPFPWFFEALYRRSTNGAVPIGTSGYFTAQIAHHFTDRNAVICSLRNYGDDNLQLKAKFYVEGFPEPQTSVFDLEKNSHREAIDWN